MEKSSWTMIGHRLENDQTQSWTRFENDVDEDRAIYHWFPGFEYQVSQQFSSGHPNLSEPSTFPYRADDGLYSSSESWSNYVEPQTAATTRYIFNDHIATPQTPDTGVWSEAWSSEYHLFFETREREEHLRSPAMGSLHTHDMCNGEPMHISHSASPSEHGGHLAASHVAAYPSEYPSPPMPAFSPGPTEGKISGPTAVDDVKHAVLCPHGCGTTLTGPHAHGNLTRHQKSRACKGSGRARTSYRCVWQGCTRVYCRSDALKVHMRRRHGAPLANPRGEGGGGGKVAYGRNDSR